MDDTSTRDPGPGAPEAAAGEPVRAVSEAATRAAEAIAEARGSAERTAQEATHAPAVAVERGRTGLTVAGLALAGFGAIFAIVRAGRSAAVDRAIARGIQSISSPAAAGVMRAASWPGFPPQSRIIPSAIIATQLGLGFRLEALFQLLAWMTAVMSTALKSVMKRPRPVAPEIRVVVAELGGSSFPSGHVLTYVGVYGFLSYLAYTLIRPAGLRRAVTGALAALVALVGPSRIHQGHHWPTDVLASYLLGLSYLIGLTSVYRRIKAPGGVAAGRS